MAGYLLVTKSSPPSGGLRKNYCPNFQLEGQQTKEVCTAAHGGARPSTTWGFTSRGSLMRRGKRRGLSTNYYDEKLYQVRVRGYFGTCFTPPYCCYQGRYGVLFLNIFEAEAGRISLRCPFNSGPSGPTSGRQWWLVVFVNHSKKDTGSQKAKRIRLIYVNSYLYTQIAPD